MHDDKEILDAYRQEGQKNRAFNIMMRKYSERLYWHIRKMVGSHEDADDLLQSTWIKAWRYLDDFREDSKLYTWLYRIATNETLTFLKREQTKHVFTFGAYDINIADKLYADESPDSDEVLRTLYQAIASLPPKQRAVFNLRYFDEMKYEDMAEVLETSVGALKASYHHAYNKVEKYLLEHY